MFQSMAKTSDYSKGHSMMSPICSLPDSSPSMYDKRSKAGSNTPFQELGTCKTKGLEKSQSSNVGLKASQQSMKHTPQSQNTLSFNGSANTKKHHENVSTHVKSSKQSCKENLRSSRSLKKGEKSLSSLKQQHFDENIL